MAWDHLPCKFTVYYRLDGADLETSRPARTPRTRSKRISNKEYAPISASSFFVHALQVTSPASKLDVRVYHTPPRFADGTVMICHHGAGYSGLSFSCFAKEVTDMSKGECGVFAFDARCHGMNIYITECQESNITRRENNIHGRWCKRRPFR